MLRIEASCAGFECQPSGCRGLAQLLQFLIRLFMQWQIVGDLHYRRVRFDGFFKQPYTTERSLPPWVSLPADRPRQAPGRDSEFCTFSFGQHVAKWLGL